MKLTWRRSSISVANADSEKGATVNKQLSEGIEPQNDKEGCLERFTSCRWIIGYLCCAARFSQSAIRQCIGMAVVCMTSRASKHTTEPSGMTADMVNLTMNNTRSSEVAVAEFAWSPEFEGLILNGFNIGFFFSPIIGGYVAGTIGGKRVVAVALLAGACVTASLPLAARFNSVLVVVLRVAAGLFLGVVDPAIQALWAKWAPKYEKAQLTTCSYTGLSLAGILTFFISGYLCGLSDDNGWPYIFYVFGGFCLVCLVPWMFLVHDSPEQHPRILDKEVRIIAKDKGSATAKQKSLSTPWKKILTSGPFYAIVVAHASYTWVTSWTMSYLPKYFKDMMKFDLQEDGVYSSLPFVGRLVTGFLAGYLSDLLLKRQVFSTGTTRKIFQTVGCLGCAVCTLTVGFLDNTSRGSAVVLLVLAMSLQNFTSVAFRINHLDIAPRFAGVLMGMTLTVGMACSLTGPPITAAIVQQGTQEEWFVIFIIVSALNVLGAAVFVLLGSGEVQDWAVPPKNDDSNHVPVVAVETSNVNNNINPPTVKKPDSLRTVSNGALSTIVSANESRQGWAPYEVKSNDIPTEAESTTVEFEIGSDTDSSDGTDNTPSSNDSTDTLSINNVNSTNGNSTAGEPDVQSQQNVPQKHRPLSKTFSMPVGFRVQTANPPRKHDVLRKRISATDLYKQGKEG